MACAPPRAPPAPAPPARARPPARRRVRAAGSRARGCRGPAACGAHWSACCAARARKSTARPCWVPMLPAAARNSRCCAQQQLVRATGVGCRCRPPRLLSRAALRCTARMRLPPRGGGLCHDSDAPASGHGQRHIRMQAATRPARPGRARARDSFPPPSQRRQGSKPHRAVMAASLKLLRQLSRHWRRRRRLCKISHDTGGRVAATRQTWSGASVNRPWGCRPTRVPAEGPARIRAEACRSSAADTCAAAAAEVEDVVSTSVVGNLKPAQGPAQGPVEILRAAACVRSADGGRPCDSSPPAESGHACSSG